MEAELQGPKATGDRVTEAVTHVQYATTMDDREAKYILDFVSMDRT